MKVKWRKDEKEYGHFFTEQNEKTFVRWDLVSWTHPQMKVLGSSHVVKTVTMDGGEKVSVRLAENLVSQRKVTWSAAWHHLEACD